jgi:apolipoprotein N-acyltransferase
MTKKKLYLLSLLSGALFFLSWPTFGFPFLLFIAFIPLLQIEHAFSTGQVQVPEGRKPAKRTLLFGLSYLSFFIWNITTTFWVCNASMGGGIAAILCNALLMSIVFWIFHITKKQLLAVNCPLPTANCLLVVFWLSFEFIHHNWELTWPWLGLGNAFASFPSCIQWYEYTGTCGGSLWVLAVNLMIFSFLENGEWKTKTGRWKMITIAAIIVIPIGISLVIYHSYNEKSDPVNIVVVQPNIDPYNEKFKSMDYEEQLEKMLNLAKQKVDSTTEYLVCPETALIEDIWENDLMETASILRLKEFLKPFPKLKIIVGASTSYIYEKGEKLSVTARRFTRQDGSYDVFNTAFQVDNSDKIQIYHKSRLVPGVERMPYPAVFGFLGKISIDLGGMSGSLGTQEERSVFTSDKRMGKNIAVAPVVCYESVFGEYVSEYVRNGANLIFIITNDGWWGDTPGYKQHLIYGRLRAIETRRSIARSGNTGISCFINERGDILQATDWWKDAVIKGSINSNSKKTFYVKFGDIIWRVSFYVSIIIILFAIALRFLPKKN